MKKIKEIFGVVAFIHLGILCKQISVSMLCFLIVIGHYVLNCSL